MLSFILLSDLHIQETDKESQHLLVKTLKEYYTIKPDADLLVLNGDLTNGGERDFIRLKELLSRTPHPPVHATMGNHDYYRMWLHGGTHYDYTKLSGDWSSYRATSQFKRHFGYRRLYHETSVRGVPFLFLSGEAYRDVDESVGEDASLSEEQLNWLDGRLADLTSPPRHTGASGGKKADSGSSCMPAFVFLHQPLPDTVEGSSLERGVVQHERLRAILAKYPAVVLFSGHTHWDLETTGQLWRGPFTAVGSGAVRGVYSAGNKPVSPLKSESLFVEVYRDGRIAVRGRNHTDERWTGEVSVIP
ncbi:metallophosphoesterase [Paenibacillus sp. GYB004]|uniref:metallophosphoesterase family protein n=1 Tax=Paenibacillus sp. GYB004 TaxID=2994393 RepID=UPI002F961D8A